MTGTWHHLNFELICRNHNNTNSCKDMRHYPRVVTAKTLPKCYAEKLYAAIRHIITASKRSLGQGNVFTSVCHSVHRGRSALGGGVCIQGVLHQEGCLHSGGAASRGGMHRAGGGVSASSGVGQSPPPHQILRETVNEWAARILLECILGFGIVPERSLFNCYHLF